MRIDLHPEAARSNHASNATGPTPPGGPVAEKQKMREQSQSRLPKPLKINKNTRSGIESEPNLNPIQTQFNPFQTRSGPGTQSPDCQSPQPREPAGRDRDDT